MTALKLIIISIIGGLIITFSPLGVLIFILFLLTFFWLRKMLPDQSKKFLIRLFVAGFLLRVIFAILNYFAGLLWGYHGADTQPDAIVYNTNAYYVASVFKGLPQDTGQFIKDSFLSESYKTALNIFKGGLPTMGKYQFGPHVYFWGMIYALFGYSPIAAKFLNCLMGALIPIVSYFISKIFIKSENIAKASAAIIMFFPSMFYWSVTLLQDTLINLLFILYVLFLLRYLISNNKNLIFISIILALIIVFFKVKIGVLLWGGIGLVFIISILRKIFKFKILSKLILTALIIAILISSALLNHSSVNKLIKYGLTNIFNYHHVSTIWYTSAANFRIYRDFIYHKNIIDINDFLDYGLIFSALKGLIYYFLSPFPWHIPYGHLLLLVFYPQTIFMFLSLPFLLLGIITSVRQNTFLTITLLMILCLFVIPQALAEAVVGNVIRHRDMFMPFIIIFSVYGFYISGQILESSTKIKKRK